MAPDSCDDERPSRPWKLVPTRLERSSLRAQMIGKSVTDTFIDTHDAFGFPSWPKIVDSVVGDASGE